MHITKLLLFRTQLALVGLALLLSGCGDDTERRADGGADGDAGVDVAVDADSDPVADATSDLAVDSEDDVEHDLEEDVSSDLSDDGTADLLHDSADTAGDATGDPSTDPTVDPSTDVTADMSPDVDDIPDVASVAAAVESVTIPDDPAVGAVDLEVVVSQAESRLTDLIVEVSLDGGGHWWSATVAPEPTGLETSEVGTAHTLSWDWPADVGIHRPFEASVRITPVTDGLVGDAVDTPLSTRFLATVADEAGVNLRERAAAVDRWAIYYGPLNAERIAALEQYDLVVVHPTAGDLTRGDIAAIQDGAAADDRADDVIVLAYLSVGEDLRTSGLTSAQMLGDARFLGDGSADGTGPRVDPRGPDADGEALDAVVDAPLGDLSPLADTMSRPFATYYLDDNSVDTADPGGDYGNGMPDGNPNFGVRFVNAGDPAWFEVLRGMRRDGDDGVSGLEELLSPAIGRAYVADGVFLDTVDTCAPNAFTDGASDNQSEFEWTAPGMAELIGRIDGAWPTQLVLQNRGLFFFDPSFEHFRFNAGDVLDFVLFESYRLDSSDEAAFSETFFASNKHSLAPRVMAEAGRSDGFRVLSMGYGEGPAWSDVGEPAATLTGASPCETEGERAEPRCALLLEDIDEAEQKAGFRHYLTDAPIALVNDFVDRQRQTLDASAPEWTSTWNDSGTFPPGPATPRVGLQEVVVGHIGRTAIANLRWDVALDFGQVGYALYRQSLPFDFEADPDLSEAIREVVTSGLAAGYERGPAEGLYPFETSVVLHTAETEYFVLRAFDDADPSNEDANEVVVAVPPARNFSADGEFGDWNGWPVALSDPEDLGGSAGPDFSDIRVANDGTALYLRITSTNPFDPLAGSFFIFIDADFDATTGWTPAGPGFGSDLLVTGGSVYGQTASGFNTGLVGSATVSPSAAGSSDIEIAVPLELLTAVDPDLTHVRVVLLNDSADNDPKDYAPDFGASIRVPLLISW